MISQTIDGQFKSAQSKSVGFQVTFSILDYVSILLQHLGKVGNTEDEQFIRKHFFIGLSMRYCIKVALSFIYRTAILPKSMVLAESGMTGGQRWATAEFWLGRPNKGPVLFGRPSTAEYTAYMYVDSAASFFFTLWDEAWKPICHRHKTVTMNHVKMALANTNVRQDAPSLGSFQQQSLLWQSWRRLVLLLAI